MQSRLKQLFSYYKPYKKLFFLDLFFALLGATITLAIPLIIRYITSTVIHLPDSTASPIILQCALLLVGFVLLSIGCDYFVTRYGHMMGALMEADMRQDIFSHYQKLSFSFFDNQKVGQLLSRITSDLFDITELLHHGPEDIVISLVKLIGAFIILWSIDQTLTLVAFLVVPLIFLYAFYLNRKMKRAFKENRKKIADINTHIEDTLSGIRVVKSFANESEEIKKFVQGNKNFLKTKDLSYSYMASYHSVINAMSTSITIIVLLSGVQLITKGQLEVTDLITFFLYISNFVEPIKKLVNFTEQFQNGYSGFERFVEMMEIEPEIVDDPNAIELENVTGKVEFENVSFHYSDSQEHVLSHINLTVPAGQYVALVGPSGSGKTTLCSLIPRFYEATNGQILIDGQDIRTITLNSLRKHIGIVQQDVYLFAGTILDNIRYGDLNATEEEIIQASKHANAHDFIMAFPDGYHTDIGQRGVKLSGGQKQRLSIARVFLKNPPILIFDEATSALDNQSEQVVQESLETLSKNRTTFVIAHRLSTIKNAQCILVLTENGIVEQGSHQELISQDGIYKDLYFCGTTF